MSKHVKKSDYESSSPRAAAAYARGATNTRVDGKPSVSHSAPPSASVGKRAKKADYERSAPRAAAAYAHGATSTRIDGKPSMSHSATPSASVSKHNKKADYKSSVPSHSGNPPARRWGFCYWIRARLRDQIRSVWVAGIAAGPGFPL